MTGDILTCRRCGRDFKQKGKELYCSEECRTAAKREQHRAWKEAHRKSALRELICPFCGKRFTQKKPAQIFCCRHCATLWHNLQRPRAGQIEAGQAERPAEPYTGRDGIERTASGAIMTPDSFERMLERSRAEHRTYGEIMAEHLAKQVSGTHGKDGKEGAYGG